MDFITIPKMLFILHWLLNLEFSIVYLVPSLFVFCTRSRRREDVCVCHLQQGLHRPIFPLVWFLYPSDTSIINFSVEMEGGDVGDVVAGDHGTYRSPLPLASYPSLNSCLASSFIS